jgi:hypothetical protein
MWLLIAVPFQLTFLSGVTFKVPVVAALVAAFIIDCRRLPS